MPSSRARGLLIVTAAGLAACGAAPPPPPPTPTAITAAPRPTIDLSKAASPLCVIAPAEAATLFGKQLADVTAVEVGAAYCAYHLRAGDQGGDDSIFLRPETAATYSSLKADPGTTPAPGVGDDAFVHDASATAVTLLVKKGGAHEEVQVYSPDLGRDGLVHVATQAAALALAKL